MRALQLITIVLAAGMIFSACETIQTPEQVAKDFLEYLEKGEFDEAKKLGTKDTHEVLESFKVFGELGEEFGETEDAEPRKISDVKCEIEGDEAKCTYMADDEKEEIFLVKEDGKWLVDMKKESPL